MGEGGRSQQMHEATRRVLGVLLRSLDGFTRGRYIVIGATNRKQDLDLALRSRFSTSVFFQLPDTETRSTPPLPKAFFPVISFQQRQNTCTHAFNA